MKLDENKIDKMLNQQAMNELKELLLKSFPDYIEKVIFFGSRVNGNAQEYSDYDILLILKKSYDWRLENEIYGKCCDINLKYDIIIDIKIISKEELQTIRGKQPFIQNAITYGVII